MFIIFNYVLLYRFLFSSISFCVTTSLRHDVTTLFSYNTIMSKLEIKPPVAILGFGVEGKAALEFLESRGIKDITICDENEVAQNAFVIPSEIEGSMRFQNDFNNLEQFKFLIRSPGVHYNRPEIEEAKKAGTIVTSMTELILEAAKDRITAVTGSNGKTTTTTLLGEILKKHYKNKVIIGGNDRKPVLMEALNHPNTPIVLEVSSFQFADIHTSPHIAAVLNITPNHMDWHENMEDYVNAKKNLIAHQTPNDWAVLNANDENSSKLAEHAPDQIFWVNKKEGKAWAVWEDNELLIKFGNVENKIMKKEEVTVKTHPDNLLFATALATLHEVNSKTIKKVMATFQGAEHRLELVRELDTGIKFYNDSSCTTPESAEVAIDQFPKGKLILLLGGSSKNADFSFLAYRIVQNEVRVYLYGDEGQRIKEAVEKENGQNLILNYNKSKNFEEIVKDVTEYGKREDNIVLSPACASFDMFKNAKERGNKFKEIVNSLA